MTAREGKLAATLPGYDVERAGIPVEAMLRILEKTVLGKWQIYFQGKTRGTKCISEKEMAQVIRSVSGRSFKPVTDSKGASGSKKHVALLFCESCRAACAYTGVAKKSPPG